VWLKNIFKKKHTEEIEHKESKNGLTVGEVYKLYPTKFCTNTVTIMEFDEDYVKFLFNDCNRTHYLLITEFKTVYDVKVL